MHQDSEIIIMNSLEAIRNEITKVKQDIAVVVSNSRNNDEDNRTTFNRIEEIKESITNLTEEVHATKTELTNFKKDFEQHSLEEMKIHEQFKDDAFPNGDAGGHKVYHVQEMERRKNTEEIKRDVTSHILKGLLWAAVISVFWSIAYGIKGWIVS